MDSASRARRSRRRLDDEYDAAVATELELLRQLGVALRGPLVQPTDRGDASRRLSDVLLALGQPLGKEVQTPESFSET